MLKVNKLKLYTYYTFYQKQKVNYTKKTLLPHKPLPYFILKG